ncbi:MAG: AlpA family phage regulatory protein [Pseudomonadota bacterium]
MEKLLTKKQVKELVGFGFAHIDRMEKDPDYDHWNFPRRVRIGFRVFWVNSEIQSWIADRIAERDAS